MWGKGFRAEDLTAEEDPLQIEAGRTPNDLVAGNIPEAPMHAMPFE